MYHIPIVAVQLVRERIHPSEVRTIASPHDAYQLLRDWLEPRDRECFAIVLLDTRSKVIGLHLVSIGSLNASIVHPRECFKPAILANASAILLAHNHPSGDASPSQEDLAITSRLKQAGELLGIAVLDHLVIGDGTFVSLKERGLL
jgi:DNA repair protein RadC